MKPDLQTAWLIERPGDDNLPTRYWNPDPGWLLDPRKACWFGREEDARAYLKHTLLGGVRVAEHVFGLKVREPEDYYPSHEALVELVNLINEREFASFGPAWGPTFAERWDRAVREAEELVRVEP